VKLKLIFVCAIALMQITPLNAQAVSPAGHYSKKSGGAGEMRVEKSEALAGILVTRELDVTARLRLAGLYSFPRRP